LNPALPIFSMVASCRLPLGNPNRNTGFFFMLLFNTQAPGGKVFAAFIRTRAAYLP